MGRSDKRETSCGRRFLYFLLTLSVLTIAGVTFWYFRYFRRNVESLVGDCGGCYCIPDESTNFECPFIEATPEASYPEATHLNAWKSQTILNPYVLNCNPYTDGVFCDTEPPLDPDFEWAKLGETAVCAVHYETEATLSRGLGEHDEGQSRRRRLQQSEIVINFDEDNFGENTTLSEEVEEDDNFTFTFDPDMCEDNKFYRIKTYSSREDAESAGGFVTHVGSCGVCSTLQDLAVYANVENLGATSPGNFCRRQAASSFENGLSCYRNMGLTQDCAKLWADTSWNTARNCFGSCVIGTTIQVGGGNNVVNVTDTNSTESKNKWYDLPATLRERFTSSPNKTDDVAEEKLAKAMPGNGPAPECALNDCITCNDEASAPTFERFAGRTRRRSGLLSTAARPCSSLPFIVQHPCPDTQPLRP